MLLHRSHYLFLLVCLLKVTHIYAAATQTDSDKDKGKPDPSKDPSKDPSNKGKTTDPPPPDIVNVTCKISWAPLPNSETKTKQTFAFCRDPKNAKKDFACLVDQCDPDTVQTSCSDSCQEVISAVDAQQLSFGDPSSEKRECIGGYYFPDPASIQGQDLTQPENKAVCLTATQAFFCAASGCKGSAACTGCLAIDRETTTDSPS